MEVENLQSVLQDAGIDVDLRTLHNPTEEFMIDLVIEYLRKFHFDGDEIAKPTPEQLYCVSCEEAAIDAIKAINLHAALTKICEEIFLKDLTLTDITSPGFKKSCKRIKVLFNFFVYVRNKKMEYEHLYLELDLKQKDIIDMEEGKDELISKIGSLIHEREDKLESIKSMRKEITEIKSQLEKNKKIKKKLQNHAEEVNIKHKEEFQKYNTLKAKAHELHKAIKDLKSKIVSSPERYVSHKKDLEKLTDEKIEERQVVNDGINRKKSQIQNNELAEVEVKKCHKTMMNIGEIVHNLKETELQISAATKQIDELKEEITLLEKKPRHEKSDCSNFLTIDLQQNQKLLSELHKMLSEKEKEHEVTKLKLEELRDKLKDAKVSLQMENQAISHIEMKSKNLSQNLKDYFKKEVLIETTCREDIKQLLNQENHI